MNEVLNEKIGDIMDRLEKILDRVSGNFSIEQQTLRNQDIGAVLLKIYQHPSEDQKDEFLILMIDEHMYVGVCESGALEGEVHSLPPKSLSPFCKQTFAPWVKSQVVEKLSNRLAA